MEGTSQSTPKRRGRPAHPDSREPGWRPSPGRGRVGRDGSSALMTHLIIVRRGAAGPYETLKTEFEHDANTGVWVMWDRPTGRASRSA